MTQLIRPHPLPKKQMVNLTQTSSPGVDFSWEDLLNLLRDELGEYGGLMGLLSSQQASILNREPENLLEINKSVRSQMEASNTLQQRRQGYVRSLATGYGKPEDSSLSELLPCFPVVTQPMFESIVEEINNLISRIRRKLDQNRRLISRLGEVTDQILAVADPRSHSKTYDKRGDLARFSTAYRPTLEESA